MTFERGRQQTPTFEAVLESLEIVYGRGHTPEQIHYAQDYLQRAHRSAQGWSYAEGLLGMPNAHARFYGALILNMKIDSDWASIGGDGQRLLQKLISWIVREVNDHKERIVIKKLCAALTAFFTQSTIWYHAVASLALSLASNSASLNNDTEQSLSMTLDLLDACQIQVLLWFSTTLAEGSTSANNDNLTKFSSEYHDSVVLMGKAFQIPSNPLRSEILLDAGGCFLAWCEYAQTTKPQNTSDKEPLRRLLSLMVETLDPFEGTTNLSSALGEVFERFANLLRENDVRKIAQVLASHARHSLDREDSLTKDDQFGSLGGLLLSFADIALKDLVFGLDSTSETIMEFLIVHMKRHDEIESQDSQSSRALDFWINYIEFIQNAEDGCDSNVKSLAHETACRRVLEIVWAGWSRVCRPSNGSTDVWDAEEASQSNLFRVDFQELVQTAYVLFGTPLLNQFADKAISLDRRTQWPQIEASLYVINALNESSAPQEAATGGILSKLLSSSLFEGDTSLDCVVLERAKLRTIMLYSNFFRDHPETFASLFDWLFGALEHPEIDELAAQAISSVCSTCSNQLHSALATFIGQFIALLLSDHLNTAVLERLSTAISSIIQTLKPETEKLSPLTAMLQAIDSRFRTATDTLMTSSSQAEDVTLVSVRCLAAMGKALRAPDEAVIEIDQDNDQFSYWASVESASLQQAVVDILFTASTVFAGSSEIIEAACWSIRAGHLETKPGLFVFAPEVMADYVELVNLGTARLEYVFETAGHMLVKQTSGTGTQKQKVAYRVLNHAKRLLEISNDPRSQDSDLKAGVLELMAKIVPHHMRSLMMVPRSGTDLFGIAIGGLRASEPPLKQAAAHFWASFLQVYDFESELEGVVEEAILVLGPLVCDELIFQVGGLSERSQLDTLAGPLKKMIFHRSMLARKWIGSSLNDSRFPSRRVGEQEKRIWLQKVMSLRGARSTNVAMKGFWMQCLGGELNHTP